MKFTSLTVLAFGVMSLLNVSYSQVSNDMTYRGAGIDFLDSSFISNKNMGQQTDFMNHQYAFPAKPKNMWEIGLKLGSTNLSASDVPYVFMPWSGYGVPGNYGLTIRKALGYLLSMRLELNHAVAKGVAWQPFGGYVESNATSYWQNLGYAPNSIASSVIPNYRTAMNTANLDLVANVGNLLFHKANNKNLLNVFFGAGAGMFKAKSNALDASGNMYDFNTIYSTAVAAAGGTPGYDVRKDIVKSIMSQMGSSKEVYETDVNPSPKNLNRYNFQNLKAIVSAGIGYQRLISPRISLGIEDRITYWTSDLLDGQSRNEILMGSGTLQGPLSKSNDQSNNIDLTMGLNLGNKNKRVLPLYWDNPNSYMYDELNNARHLRSPAPVMNDDDGDGVINQLDQEPNSPAGCPVNTHGVTLDTDGDGVPDCRDKQLITPTECQPSDADGVGHCPCNCKGEISSNPKCNFSNSFTFAGSDLSAANIAKIQSMISELQKSDCKIVVEGYGNGDKKAQQRSWDRVNRVINYISENGNISRDRFIFKSGQAGPANQVSIRAANPGEDGQDNVPPPFPHLIGK